MKTKINLESLISIESTSGEEDVMRKHLVKVCKSLGAKVEADEWGNLYVVKGKTKSFPCVVAHMDTVHRVTGNGIIPVLVRGWWVALDAKDFSQVGTGGDDKCGIYVALRALEALDAVKVAFFHSEEVGCVGSYQARVEWFGDCRYVLQCDRRGASDWVDDINGPLGSAEFHAAMSPYLVRHGFKRCAGAMSDVMALRNLFRAAGAGVSVANMSAAYYNPHQDCERINAAELENVTRMVLSICREVGDSFPFACPASTKSVYSGGDYGARWSKGRYSAKGSAKYIASTVGAEGGYYRERIEWAGRKVGAAEVLPVCPECRDTVDKLVEGWGCCSECLRSGLDYSPKERYAECRDCSGYGYSLDGRGGECETCGGCGEVPL